MKTLTAFAFTLPAPSRLLTENGQRRLHWGTRASIISAWRQAGAVYARHENVPRFEWVEIGVNVHQKRGVLADAGAHFVVVKAAIDGLVDAGVLPGDTPRHLRSLVQHAPVRGADALVLHLRGELREGILDD